MVPLRNEEPSCLQLNRVGGVFDNLLFLLSLSYMFFILSEFKTDVSMLISAGMFCVWLFGAFLLRPLIFYRFFSTKKYLAFSFLILFYAFSILISMSLFEGLKIFFGALVIFSPMIIYDYYSRTGKRSYCKVFILSILCILVYLSFRSLYYLSIYRGIARAMSSTSIYGYIGMGGGFKLAYAFCILVPSLLFIALRYVKNHLIVKILLILMTALFFYTVVKSDYTLAFIFTVIFSLLAVFLPKKPNTVVLIVLFVLPIFAIVILLFYHSFGEMLLRYSENQNNYIGKRLYELANFIIGNGSSSDLSYRLTANFMSLKAFLSHPISGIGIYGGFDNAVGLSSLGQHCEWSDALGKWGLVGAVPYFLTIIYQIREYHDLLPQKNIFPYFVGFTVLMNGLFNPFFFSALYAVISVLLPGILRYFIFENISGERDG